MEDRNRSFPDKRGSLVEFPTHGITEKLNYLINFLNIILKCINYNFKFK